MRAGTWVQALLVLARNSVYVVVCDIKLARIFTSKREAYPKQTAVTYRTDHFSQFYKIINLFQERSIETTGSEAELRSAQIIIDYAKSTRYFITDNGW